MHANELQELNTMSYHSIYEKAVQLFKKGRIGINLHKAAIKALGLEDTRSLYILNYTYYLHGYKISVCVNHIKHAIRQEIFNQVNIPLTDIYDKHYESLFEQYDLIPFDGIRYTMCKMLIDGVAKSTIRKHLNLTLTQYHKLEVEMMEYILANDYCGRTTYLLDTIKTKYQVEFMTINEVI